jgi:transketolase
MSTKSIEISKTIISLREAFGISLTKISVKNKKILVLDADLKGGTGTHHFEKKYPNQFIQCGIAEQNMFSMASGIASLGFIPFATTFAVFTLRAFEQIRLQISYENANVKIVSSHGGLDVGPDGKSAQCLEDFACFRSLPNFTIISPCDANEMFQATKEIIKLKGPVYMRTGRSPITNIYKKNYKFKIGKGHILNKGKKICVISTGIQTSIAFNAIKILKNKGFNPTLISMPTIKPLDKNLIIKQIKNHKYLVSFEDHNIIGGLGSAISEVISDGNFIKLIRMGMMDIPGQSGEASELKKKFQIDENALIKKVIKLFNL